jgi:hypothetical protein
MDFLQGIAVRYGADTSEVLPVAAVSCIALAVSLFVGGSATGPDVQLSPPAAFPTVSYAQ